MIRKGRSILGEGIRTQCDCHGGKEAQSGRAEAEETKGARRAGGTFERFGEWGDLSISLLSVGPRADSGRGVVLPNTATAPISSALTQRTQDSSLGCGASRPTSCPGGSLIR